MVLVLQIGILKKRQPPIAKNQRHYISCHQYEKVINMTRTFKI